MTDKTTAEECGAHGPPNGWLCRETKGHSDQHVYRPDILDCALFNRAEQPRPTEALAAMAERAEAFGCSTDLVQWMRNPDAFATPGKPMADAGLAGDSAFLKDLAGRIFRKATPLQGFDQGDVDQLYRIASALTTGADGVAAENEACAAVADLAAAAAVPFMRGFGTSASVERGRNCEATTIAASIRARMGDG